MSSETIPFEGVEKRLVIQFATDAVHQNTDFSTFDNEGRIKSPVSMSPNEWQEILDHASCSIVSERSLGADSKVYLLSESTLYVWKTGFLLKTCGRTTPFLALQTFLRRYGVSSLEELSVSWMTYSRLDFLHPKYQVYPHRNFGEEREFLSALTSKIEHTAIKAGAHTLFAMFAAPCPQKLGDGYSMDEVLMTGVRCDCVRELTGYDNQAEQQLHDDGSADKSVLRKMLQKCSSEVHDEFWFDPCGYSANVLLGYPDQSVDYFSTHISPEPVTSYASLELGSTSMKSTFERSEDFSLDPLITPFRAQNVNVTRFCVRLADASSVNQEIAIQACADYTLQTADRHNFKIGQYICEIGHLAFTDSPEENVKEYDDATWFSQEGLAVSY